jgi:hypothetical protein
LGQRDALLKTAPGGFLFSPSLALTLWANAIWDAGQIAAFISS